MLDRIHPRLHRVMHAIQSHRVRSHFVPLAMRLVHNRPQLIQREGRNVIQHAILTHPVTAVAVNLDPVRPIHDLLANCLPPFFWPIHHLDAMGHRHIRRISQQRISPRHIQRPRRHLHARPRNHAIVDSLLQIHIGISRALSLDIANRREPIFQSPPRIHRSQNRPILPRLLQQLHIVVRCRDVALK